MLQIDYERVAELMQDNEFITALRTFFILDTETLKNPTFLGKNYSPGERVSAAGAGVSTLFMTASICKKDRVIPGLLPKEEIRELSDILANHQKYILDLMVRLIGEEVLRAVALSFRKDSKC